ncbi:hypothetical protein [Formosa haliotis]|uniref:hypothetical protein n=1 Tax=Formosa haliotis TaxID=1555194 RepID=UPI000824CB5D|nr:hypothetical protein [Formosa haliotis]
MWRIGVIHLVVYFVVFFVFRTLVCQSDSKEVLKNDYLKNEGNNQAMKVDTLKSVDFSNKLNLLPQRQ